MSCARFVGRFVNTAGALAVINEVAPHGFNRPTGSLGDDVVVFQLSARKFIFHTACAVNDASRKL